MKEILKNIYQYFKGKKEPKIDIFSELPTCDTRRPMKLPSGMLHYIDNNGIDTLESYDRLIDGKNRRLVNYKMSKFPNIKRDNELRYNQMANDQDYYIT